MNTLEPWPSSPSPPTDAYINLGAVIGYVVISHVAHFPPTIYGTLIYIHREQAEEFAASRSCNARKIKDVRYTIAEVRELEHE